MEQLSVLLSLAEDPERARRAIAVARLDPAALQSALRTLGPAGSEDLNPLLSELLRPGIALSRAREIKSEAKRRYVAATDRKARNALAVLYHASVAAGLATHGVLISSRPLERRIPVYQDLAEALGGHPLGILFRRAVTRAVGLIREDRRSPPSPAV